jgi:hypothetical protein
MSRLLVALLAIAFSALVAVGCGGGDDGDSPSANDVPSGAVATVGDVEVSKQDLDEQVAVLVRAQGPQGGGEAADVSRELRDQLEAQALALLLMRQALEQEAADRDVEVSDAEVRERWEAASKSQFKTKRALKRFLGGQTERELLGQLRLQLLTERIHQQVSEEAGGGKQGAKAIREFQKEFLQRWQDRTACAEGYTASGCGGSS